MDMLYNRIIFNIRSGAYSYIGSGSCRSVYDMHNGYVVKVAKNMAGVEQNRVEYTISMEDNTNLFAKVLFAAKDYSYIIMKKAKKVSSMLYVRLYFSVTSERDFLNLYALQKIKNKYNLILDDLNRESSWGIIDKKVVIIDYGFTKRVKERYY